MGASRWAVMTQGFSMIEAATSGLVVLRTRPLAWAGASLLYLAGSLVELAIQLGPAAPFETRVSDAMAAMAGAPPTADGLRTLVELQGQMGLMTLPSTLVLMALVNTVVYRAVFRPEDSRFMFLRLGPEEARQLLVQIMLWGVIMVAASAVSVILSAAAAIAPGPALGLVVLLGGAAMVGVTLHLWARLSLATSATFAEGGLRLARSWRLTEGCFWRILGAYILAALTALAVSVLWSVLVSGVTGGVMGDRSQAITAGGFDGRAFFDSHAPAMLTAYVLSAPLGGLVMLLTLVPGAVIYRALSGREAARPV